MVSILHAARDIGRFRAIATVLVRHGFGESVRRLGFGRRRARDPAARSESGIDFVSPDEEARGARERERISPAVRARLVLEDLGPSFVKLGQIASTRPDILPPDLIGELEKLQDSVPPVPFAKIKEQIETSLGAELTDIYDSIDEAPLAAASIAQVHRAVLKTDDGLRDVVVKVQRPGIAATIASDLDILHAFAALLERAVPESRIYSPVGLVQQFDRAIVSELDFSAEADNALRFAKNFEQYRSVRFPRVYRQASSKHVLTLEYLDGLKIYDAIKAGHSGHKLARVALDAIVRQIFEDGFFHADPHPGNLFVLGPPDDPCLAFIDLGMVGHLSPRLRDLTVDVMVNVVRRDFEGIADAMYALGTPTKKIDMDAYRAEVALLAEKYLGKQLKDIELSSLIGDLVHTATKYGVEIPTDFVLVGKTLMTVEGVGKQIAPELDVFDEAKPLFLEIIRKRYSPERIGNELLRRIEKLSGATYNVPQRLEEVLDDLRLGRLRIHAEDPGLLRAADRLGRRLFAALVIGALLLSGTWLLASKTNDLAGGILIGLSILVLMVHTMLDAYRGFRR